MMKGPEGSFFSGYICCLNYKVTTCIVTSVCNTLNWLQSGLAETEIPVSSRGPEISKKPSSGIIH